MPKFIFGIYTKDGRFIERVVDALNEAAARKLVLEGFADEEIRLCMVDAEPEGDPKKREALIRVGAAKLPALGPRLHTHPVLPHHHGIGQSAAILSGPAKLRLTQQNAALDGAGPLQDVGYGEEMGAANNAGAPAFPRSDT